MNKNPLVFIIVLNWNGEHHLPECLGSLSKIDYSNYKIVLVDNASQDGSIPFVRSNYPHVFIIQNKRNLGYAEGNNVGIRYALSCGADYVVLLNNDTRVEPNFLSPLIKRGEEKKDIGVLGGRVLMFFDPLIVNSTGVNLNRFAYGWDRDFGEDTRMLHREGGEVLAVTGSLMAIKREVFEKIGLFDHKFFAYFEDVDFCIRVWKYTDFKIEYVPASVIYHKFSASTSRNSRLKRYLMMRNQYRIFFKHFPILNIATTFPMLSLHRFRFLLYYLKRGDFYLFSKEAFTIFKQWVILPFVFLYRLSDYIIKRPNTKRFWRMVIPETKFPSIKAYSPGYERVFLDREELEGKAIPNRIVMGVNDEVLGAGWSRLINGSPRFRRMGEKATIFLRNELKFGFLQIHGINTMPYSSWLEVVIEGQMVGRRQIERGWNTYLIPFENKFREGPIEIQLKVSPWNQTMGIENGFGINEIGLLPLGSPILRLMED